MYGSRIKAGASRASRNVCIVSVRCHGAGLPIDELRKRMVVCWIDLKRLPLFATLCLTVFSVQQVAHRLPASFVLFARVGGKFALAMIVGFRFAAIGTAVGETGLAGLQFELFSADDANSDGECHKQLPATEIFYRNGRGVEAV